MADSSGKYHDRNKYAPSSVEKNNAGRLPGFVEPEPIVIDPFQMYLRKAGHEEDEFMDDCNQGMDTLLVFAGLFSAVTTAFIIETYKDLKPEPETRSELLLEAILRQIGDASGPRDVVTEAFYPKGYSVITNALFFLSLSFSLLAALGAIMIKQWARKVFFGLRKISSPRERAREYLVRRRGIEKGRIGDAIALIPMLLHVALALFFTGLIFWLRALNSTVYKAVVVCGSVGLASYLGIALIPTFWRTAPFQWPVSTGLRWLLRSILQLFRCFTSTPYPVDAGETIPIYIDKLHPSNESSPASHSAQPRRWLWSSRQVSSRGSTASTWFGTSWRDDGRNLVPLTALTAPSNAQNRQLDVEFTIQDPSGQIPATSSVDVGVTTSAFVPVDILTTHSSTITTPQEQIDSTPTTILSPIGFSPVSTLLGPTTERLWEWVPRAQIDEADFSILNELATSGDSGDALKVAADALRIYLSCNPIAGYALKQRGRALNSLLGHFIRALSQYRIQAEAGDEIRTGELADLPIAIMRFYEVALQTEAFDGPECKGALRETLELARLLLDQAKRVGTIAEMALYGSVTAQIERNLGSWDHLYEAGAVFYIIGNLGPRPWRVKAGEKRRYRSHTVWTEQDLDTFQDQISGYIWSITQLLLYRFSVSTAATDMEKGSLAELADHLADLADTGLIQAHFSDTPRRDDYPQLSERFATLWLTCMHCHPTIADWIKIMLLMTWKEGDNKRGVHQVRAKTTVP